MVSASESQSALAARAAALAPWATAAFWIGALGVAVSVGAASVRAVGALSDGAAVLSAVNAVLLALLVHAPTIALLQGLWASARYLRAVAGGAAVEAATLAVLREVGDCCVWAGLLAMVIVPNVLVWVRQEGGVDVRIEPEFLALTGLGVLLGLIGRVLALSVRQAADAKAELDQIV